jgi:hypothetical protein
VLADYLCVTALEELTVGHRNEMARLQAEKAKAVRRGELNHFI